MNERIRELMKEAQVIYDYAPFYGDMDRDPKPLYKLDPEKFAELIVRECANFIDSKLEMTEYSHEVVSWADGNDLKEHFGVD